MSTNTDDKSGFELFWSRLIEDSGHPSPTPAVIKAVASLAYTAGQLRQSELDLAKLEEIQS